MTDVCAIPPLTVPDGLVARPLSFADVEAVTELIATCEERDVGERLIELADVMADWQRPSFVIARQSVGVWDGAALVGYAEVYKGRFADCQVRPDRRESGLGEALAAWMVALARRDGGTLVGMPVPEGGYGELVLRAAGWESLWTSWVLRLPQGVRIVPQPVPPGYVVRGSVGVADHEPAYHVQEDAFLEWSERERESFDEWAPAVVRRPGFEDWNLRLACDPAGTIVGMAFVTVMEGCGFLGRLAVRPDQRVHGLGRALLVDSFAVAREHGGLRSELSTDSRTGALSLYEKVGMIVTSRWFHLARALS